MMKDYTKWHNKKALINKIEPRPFFHEREVWYCAMGVNVGFEQDGRGTDFLRPVIIYKKFNNEIFLAFPLTRTEKESKFYFQFIFQDNAKSAAILSQIRLIDARRLDHKIGVMKTDDFEKLTKKFKELIP
ncbi:MAG TPA: hypothetical protein DEP95_01445 [Candidatus Staskawiczbacteria bacterium]|nr:hypothetical protein [Candidatus Staskawiczbacteria bacterium]